MNVKGFSIPTLERMIEQQKAKVKTKSATEHRTKREHALAVEDYVNAKQVLEYMEQDITKLRKEKCLDTS